jgi:hypothetical protein
MVVAPITNVVRGGILIGFAQIWVVDQVESWQERI